MIKRLLLTAFTVLCVLFTFAQETTSDIQGLISDGKAGLAGATVVALHTPTGTRYTTTTRKDGRFNLANVRVGGPYTITVTYVGFREEKQENVTLVLGQTFFADFTLTPESKELSTVIVPGTRQNKIFNTSHTGSQEIVTRAQIERLPTIARSIQDFTKLEPTAVNNFGSQSFAGANPGMNNITVDGADFNNSFGLSGTLGGQASAQPIALDAIDQIQVNISPYDVRQGGFTGAGVNSVTRSGTNKWRGTVYDYIRNANTIGYNADNNVVAKTPFNLNVLGGSFGGAIIKNKLFFFINAEQDIQTAPATSVIASDATHSPLPGVVSQANADTLTALANFLKTTYNYDPGAFQGYSFKTNSYKVNAKVDFNINDANVLTFKYNYLKSYQDQFASTSRSLGAGGLTTGGQPGTFSMPFYGSGYRINNDLDIYILELNTRFGNKASNKLQVGYTKERDFRSPHSGSPDFPLVDILNGGNIYTTFGYEPFTFNNKLYMDSYQVTDIFNFYKGAHEITVGSQNSYKKYQNAFAPGYNGAYQFSSLDQFLQGGTAALYGQQYSTLKGGAFPFAYAGATNLSLFAQDKYRVTPNFTLTYGIRFDYTTYQNKFTDNPQFDALTFKNGATYNVGKAPNGFLVISPRAGFNWDLTGEKIWQLRGGAGIFEGAPPFVWIENQAANNGVQFGSFTSKNVPFFPTAQAGLNNYLTTTGQSQTSTPTGYTVNVAAKNFKYPTKLRTSIGLDRKLGDQWVITGEFTYSKDINATYMSNINLNEQNAFAIANGPDNRMRFLTTTAGSNAYYAGLPTQTLTNPALGTSILLSNTNIGYSYDATIRIQKTVGKFTGSVAYTYSDTKSAMENGSTAGTLWSARAVSNTDPNAATLGRPSWYQPNRLIAYANYRLEYAHHFATSFGAVFEVAPTGVTSYVYNGDLNGDAQTGNDLIYIPRNSTEINLIDAGSYNKTTQSGITTGTAADPRTSAQIWTQLNNFINQDHYLYHHKGQYAKANSVVEPYFKHLDLNVTQDFYLTTHRGSETDKHTIQVSVDLINAGNLLNRNWGLIKTPTISNFLKFEGMAADNRTPLFSFPYADQTNQVPLVNSFANSTSLGSRWQMQIGVRYLFN
ncbi:MAG: TonB-dependent receptor [Bacteroidota bacterium]|nr:TonB-dependent receptor [Bacteroidota bacterium]MDP4215442.1 TonB-dependent receptor [Bacteroidota bacterium]MDP4255507.1 TonB-dependent receptor [Bacteroidota bacterium]MDP4257514.1 TonB-dependent receptor [Bacteroidota bacterium]